MPAKLLNPITYFRDNASNKTIYTFYILELNQSNTSSKVQLIFFIYCRVGLASATLLNPCFDVNGVHDNLGPVVQN